MAKIATYLSEVINEQYIEDKSVLALPVASWTGGASGDATVAIQMSKPQLRRRVEVHLVRLGEPPERPAALSPKAGEALLFDGTSTPDPYFDNLSNPVYTLAGAAEFAVLSGKKPDTVSYPPSPVYPSERMPGLTA